MTTKALVIRKEFLFNYENNNNIHNLFSTKF